MLSEGDVWGLVRGERRIADLVVTSADFPWLNARIQRLPGFEGVEPLFHADIAGLDTIGTEDDAWEAAHAAIRAEVKLIYPNGVDVPEFILHIDGDDAWWRWSDEPFDE